MDPPVAYIRRLTPTKTPFTLLKGNTPTPDFQTATHVSFPDPSDPANPDKFTTFSLDAPSGYREYALSTIVQFFLHRDLEHAAYLQQTVGAQPVSLIHRRDLLTYLDGGNSVHVKSVAAPTTESGIQDCAIYIVSEALNFRVFQPNAAWMNWRKWRNQNGGDCLHGTTRWGLDGRKVTLIPVSDFCVWLGCGSCEEYP